MTFGTIASIVGIAGGIKALTSSSGGGGGAAQAQYQQAADPFSGYRSQLGEMYAGALQPGATSNIQNMPGYTQFNTGVMQPAMQASQRAAAATGNLYSGAEQLQLQKVGQQGYYGFMTDYMNRLAQGSGAVNNPAQAAALGFNAQNQSDQAFMQGMGGIATGLRGFASSGSIPGGPGYNYMYSDANSVGPPVSASNPYNEYYIP
jgi:hypothetical protein